MPDGVSRNVLSQGLSPVRAWREHLDITQREMAARLRVTQQAYAQLENSRGLRKSSLQRLAHALGIELAQVDFCRIDQGAGGACADHLKRHAAVLARRRSRSSCPSPPCIDAMTA